MDLTGPIFALIALAWLAFLVPAFLRRREQRAPEPNASVPFGSSLQLVHAAMLPEDDFDEDLEVSTPLTRAAQRYGLVVAQRVAARRRRRVLIALLAATVIFTVTGALHRTSWLLVLLPIALSVAFLAISRVSVTRMHAGLARKAHDIENLGDMELTQEFSFDLEEPERSVEISAPMPHAGSLWEPVPVTRATYVQKPLAPRTVRTIDLSAPHAAAAVPPIAAAPDEEREESHFPAWGAYERPRAVGE